MVRGIQLFKDFFSGCESHYAIIGGAACDLLLSEAGLSFRATRDPVLNTRQLILFKVKAWLDLTAKRAAGAIIDSKDIIKHKNDVYRLAGLLSTEGRCNLTPNVKHDLNEFLLQISKIDDKGFSMFKRVTKEVLINLLRDVYEL